MKTEIETLKDRHAQELANLERKQATVALLPVEPRFICAHNGSGRTMSASYEVATLADAMAIYSSFLPLIVDAEAWKSGCISVLPAAINRYAEAKHETSTLQFTAHAENAALYKRVRDAAMRVLSPDAVVLSFGWNSSGMGKGRGFELIEQVNVCHGGAHNDTICIAERRVANPQAALALG